MKREKVQIVIEIDDEVYKRFMDDYVGCPDIIYAVRKGTPLPSYNSIKTELKPYEDSIRELIKEFDDKHPALFADYMQEFNNHPISEIIEYMWDMHDLIEDIKYRLPKAESEDEDD